LVSDWSSDVCSSDLHATARSEVGRAIAAMLDDDKLPSVPAQSNGGAGEVLALGHLFYDLSVRLELTPKERMALINGSPCAGALRSEERRVGKQWRTR